MKQPNTKRTKAANATGTMTLGELIRGYTSKRRRTIVIPERADNAFPLDLPVARPAATLQN